MFRFSTPFRRPVYVAIFVLLVTLVTWSRNGLRSGRPRRVLASFSSGHPKYAQYQRENCAKAMALGIDECMMYNISTLDPEWSARNAHILKHPLGAGLWSWKAFTIFQSLMRVREGDIVLYMDSGSVIVKDPTPLFDIAEREDIVLFSECQWTVGQYATRSSLFLTNGDKYIHEWNIVAGYNLWRKSSRALMFLSEWLTYLQDERILTGDPIPGLDLPNYPMFIDHRHDMVPLVVSGYRWGIPFRRSPTQWGSLYCQKNYSNSPYGELFYEM
jgi:hypothetical protein